MKPSLKETEKLLQCEGEVRFSYSIKRIADNERVWVIGDANGLASFGDPNNNTLFPIWPFEEFARLCCIEQFIHYSPEAIELDIFMDDYLVMIKEKGYLLTIFPLPSNMGVVLTPEEFGLSIEDELEKY